MKPASRPMRMKPQIQLSGFVKNSKYELDIISKIQQTDGILFHSQVIHFFIFSIRNFFISHYCSKILINFSRNVMPNALIWFAQNLPQVKNILEHVPLVSIYHYLPSHVSLFYIFPRCLLLLFQARWLSPHNMLTTAAS